MTPEQQFVDTALRAWKFNVDRVEASFAKKSDQELETVIAPGRNRLIYLLGHIAAVHDRLLPLLGAGERKHAELDKFFLEEADTGAKSPMSAAALKGILVETDAALWSVISKWSPAEWVTRHTAVSDEDFAKEPHRNRLSVLLSRNSHLAFHHGQIVLTEPRG